jgi:CheY-like chemotaxis protein
MDSDRDGARRNEQAAQGGGRRAVAEYAGKTAAMLRWRGNDSSLFSFVAEGSVGMVPAEVIALHEPVLLIVEDEILVRVSVCDFLRNAGFTVIEAGNAREALAVLKVRNDVALVMTDLHMSGTMEGIELIREIRKTYPGIKVVTASVHQSSEPVEASVTKPFSLERLLEVIESVLRR